MVGGEDTRSQGPRGHARDAERNVDTTLTAKHLGSDSLGRFQPSEKLLFELQQQTGAKEYRGVAIELDGRAVGDGLGRLRFVRPADVKSSKGGGILWMQASDADIAAKKELRDITNTGSDSSRAREPVALFIPLRDVSGITSVHAQNSVVGAEMVLVNAQRLAITFMSGPSQSTSDRDEFLSLVTRAVQDGDVATELPTPLVASGDNSCDSVMVSSDCDATTAALNKASLRALVRQYMHMDSLDDAAIELSLKVYNATGYHLGPMAKTMPSFSEDASYRKESVDKLSRVLSDMNAEWSSAEAQRELHTKTTSSRNEDDLYVYHDASTGEEVSPRSYEQRYAEYVRLHDEDPIIRRFMPQNQVEGSTAAGDQGDCRLETTASKQLVHFFGLDISASCIVDEAFFVDGAKEFASPSTQFASAQHSAVAAASRSLWQHLSTVFSSALKARGADQSGKSSDSPSDHLSACVDDTTPSAQPRESQLLPPVDRKRRRDQLQTPVQRYGIAHPNGTFSSPSKRSRTLAERGSRSTSARATRRSHSRSDQNEQDRHVRPNKVQEQARRKPRRQSIVGTLYPSLTATPDGSYRDRAGSRRANSSQKSTRRDQASSS